ncbi:UNVERIFIED_ORG: 1-acyl-sn-glycerol-3-phosphate acyltransferase [Nocardia globerula]|uniref:1-acyl-sn-glycerol-3-phosphate acyltransferase n=1 Tax=Nocardia globerula TaxID=1818 RepID=A0A652YQ03_NOCGL|nr:lysophospholipid acyltransferase family protein [Rhodococcus globerulus]NMD62872.1 1-acyl-sn-glycerol-3-phosphate acyltransferase [Nocardia globerula]PVX68325.1 1-acyl-sn-glycerol-3-phosphate acyltransferase [Rhodococcus globerulus]
MTAEPVYTAVETTARVLCRLQGLAVTRTGTENVPRTGGAVIAINHTSYLDFIHAALAVRESKRKLRVMAKTELANNKVLAFLMRGCGVIEVDRSAGAAAFQVGVDGLRRGELVGVYPEATISRSFEIKEFKSGAARMAIEANVPIIPVIVWGAQRLVTKGGPKNLGRNHFPISVEVGAPIDPVEPADALTEILRIEMDAILHHVQDGFAHEPGGYWVPRRLGGGAPTPEEAAAMDMADRAKRAL